MEKKRACVMHVSRPRDDLVLCSVRGRRDEDGWRVDFDNFSRFFGRLYQKDVFPGTLILDFDPRTRINSGVIGALIILARHYKNIIVSGRNRHLVHYYNIELGFAEGLRERIPLIGEEILRDRYKVAFG
tara:strand:- start:5291 stop:5677 length:387 start_codon:yes stop_codon:yes gene_type:complete